MLRHLFSTSLAALVAALLPVTTQAADYISGSVGYYDALRHKDTATQFGLEYRFSELLYGIRPIVGGFMTTDGGAYGYGGFNWDVPVIANQLYVVPNFAVGAYRNGSGRDLGGTLEFRSGIEVDYQFPNTHQLGIALNHISNASIYNRNPGEETVLVNYSVPVNSLFNW